MNLIENKDEVDYLLGKIDPFNNNKMTYSEVIQLLSSHMVPSGDDQGDYQQSIPILEKFSHLGEQQQHDDKADPDNYLASSAAPSHDDGSYSQSIQQNGEN